MDRRIGVATLYGSPPRRQRENLLTRREGHPQKDCRSGRFRGCARRPQLQCSELQEYVRCDEEREQPRAMKSKRGLRQMILLPIYKRHNVFIKQSPQVGSELTLDMSTESSRAKCRLRWSKLKPRKLSAPSQRGDSPNSPLEACLT